MNASQKGNLRRENILQALQEATGPISASQLASRYGVSRQVIVQDVALLRVGGADIQATASGYVLRSAGQHARIFKSYHSDEDTAEELTICVDLGGCVQDIFVYHRVYGVVRGELGIRSRLDVQRFMDDVSSGKSTLLKNTTGGYHYHTVTADSEEVLNLIQQALTDRGFLAPLTDYEPVNFWEDA